MGAMTRIDLQIRNHERPNLAMGTGFIALDIVEGKLNTFGAAGGSCGNVMAMLAWLGWTASPIGRLGADAAGEFVVSEYAKLGVDCRHIVRDENVATPIVIQRFGETAEGERTHRFSLSCPDCGGWLPRFRPMTISQAAPVLESSLAPKVFYLDRVTPASLRLARWAKDLGALVLFEPSSVGDEKPFQRAIDLCHVLKYSHDRLGHIPDLAAAQSPDLIVETLGEQGLRMRWRGSWSVLPAFKTDVFEDAAGSGDWCSAGLLHLVGARGADAFQASKRDDLERALKFGQALATLNCRFEGARGLMSFMDHQSVNKAFRELLETRVFAEVEHLERSSRSLPEDLCSLCKPQKKTRARNKKKAG